MKIEAALALAVPLIYLSLLVVELRHAARSYEIARRWRLLGSLFFVVTMTVGGVIPHLLPIAYLKSHSVLDLSDLGVWSIPAGVLATTFFGYWLHRAEHRFNWLWRATHQLHHSPNRVDLWGAFYTHPLEVMVKVAMGTLVASLLLGLSPIAASAVGLVSAVLSMFQHWNIHTPRMLGYFVQRPESHCLHHERDLHTRNFGDLPLWDMVFGTFQNPHAFNGKVGFSYPASTRMGDMLLMRDIHPSSQEDAS